LLTQKTLVFKGALARHRSSTTTTLSAMASDLQVERHVASFFLEDFLGCELVDSAPVATEKFFDAAEKWVETLDDPEKQHRYEVALLATMHSADRTVDPVQFANNSLSADEHQSFIDHLTQDGVRTARFPKDTSNIDGRIKRLAYNFESGIRLVGTPDAMDEHVRIVTEDQQDQVIVEDQIKAIRARG
jgi:37-kD nucleoid-associated bacterial protein